jgi:hypothetical protein
MNNFTQNYEKILETLQSVESRMHFLNQIRKPKLSDIELIAIDLTSEFSGIDSERDLFRKLPIELFSKEEHSVYNRRKRRLFYHRDLGLKFPCVETKRIISYKPVSSENQENGLKPYFLSSVTNL